MPAALTQDLKLLDILEALPSDEEPNSEALRQRLKTLCATQSMEATDARIERAVDHYLAQRSPAPTTSALSWARPASQEEWVAIRNDMQEALNQFQRLLTGLGISLLVLMGAGLLALLTQMVVGQNRFSGWLGIVFLAGLTSVFWGFPVYQIIKAVVLERRPWLKRARQLFTTWTGANRVDPENAALMEAVQPDVKRLARWLKTPQSAAALQIIAKGPVPVTRRDAQQLDRLVAEARAAAKAQHAQNQAQEWEDSLRELAAHA